MKTRSTLTASAILMTTLAASLLAGPRAHAGPIVGAVNAIVESGGVGFPGTFISDSYNQKGLTKTYVSGVTDFDAYIASNPLHVSPYGTHDWFSDNGVASISVVYDLGSLWDVEAVAFWNEDMGGVGAFNLYYSQDNLSFFDLALGLVPTNNPVDVSYLPDVFSFSAMSARYIRLVGTNCPGVPQHTYAGCTLGEIAFGTATPPPPAEVDEPPALILLCLGMLGIALRRRAWTVAPASA